MKKYKVVNEDKFIRFCLILFVLAVIILSVTYFPVAYWLADLMTR